MNRGLVLLILAIIVLVLIIIIYLSYYPKAILWPYNSLVSCLVESKTFHCKEEKELIFPNCRLFENEWVKIRKEALSVLNETKDNVWKNFDLADASFWKGWKAFTMRLYGEDVPDNLRKCPTVAKILKECPEVHTAVFSVLEPGKTIPPHYGPFKGVLRYHLGLVVPKEDNKRCYIRVGGDEYDWKEGQGVLFDETFLHSAHNDTSQVRVVLYLDVPRPMPYEWLEGLNNNIMWLIQNSPQNQTAVAKTKMLARKFK